jgi:hypothetical protein
MGGLDVKPYSNRLDADDQVTAEEEIAATIFDKMRASDLLIHEDTAAELGRTILNLVLERFRPDLFEGAASPPPGPPADADEHVVVGFESDGGLIYSSLDGCHQWTDGVRLEEYGTENLSDEEVESLLAHPKCAEHAHLITVDVCTKTRC